MVKVTEQQTEKTYSIAGVSKFNGVRTFRFANGKLNLRTNMLRFQGHEDIKLVELPKPMTKVAAAAWLIDQGYKGVIPTRASDKSAVTPVLEAARKLADRRQRARATRAANKAVA